MNLKKLENLTSEFKNKKIVVIGDLMIDHYVWGEVNRISPEAPVPIVKVDREEYRLGGASNVAFNIKTLGATPIVLGIAGNDSYGKILKDLFESKKINSDNIILSDSKKTIIKSRIIAHNQQVVRIDFEEDSAINAEIESLLIEKLEALINDVDAVILEDYNKGLLTKTLISKIISLCTENDVIVTVDPKFDNFFSYKNVDVFKPNLNEMKKNLNVDFINEKDFEDKAVKLRNQLECKYLMITRGEKGLTVFSENDVFTIPTYAQKVFDVSGAGDTVISTLTLCLSCGEKILPSSIIANHAAGSVCGKIGVEPVYIDDIVKSFKDVNENN